MDKIFFKPNNLRVDFDSSEIAVTDNTQPVFSWSAVNEIKGSNQKKYRVVVFKDDEVFWDSGYIESQNTLATYAGDKLVHNNIYEWSVTLIDDKNNTSQTAYAKFIVSYGENIQADFITTNDYVQKQTYCFFKEFNLCKKVKRAVLSISGLGFYELYINGYAVDSHMFKPVFSNYDKIIYYNVFIIDTEILSESNNRIDIILADGWRNNQGKWSEQMVKNHEVPLFGVPMLLVDFELIFDDDSVYKLKSDETFKVKRYCINSHLFEGETYDENLDICDNNAKYAVVKNNISAKLCPQTIPYEKMQETYNPVNISQVGHRKFIVDFGVNIAGVCNLFIPKDIDTDDIIKIEHSEILNSDNSLYTENLRSAYSVDRYIINKNIQKDIVWHPLFTYHGFRYVCVSGIECLSYDMIKAVAIYTDVYRKSSFICSDNDINNIQKAIIQTEKCNIHGYFTDCPQRDERMGWMNDATARFDEVVYNFDVVKLFEKVIADCVSEQGEFGEITCTAPYFFGEKPSDAVCSAFIIAAYYNMLYYHDMNTAKRYYKNMKLWNDCLSSMACDDILYKSFYGDWASPADYCVSFENPHSKVTPDNFISTMFYYNNYVLLYKITSLLGMKSESDYNKKRAQEVKTAIKQKWLDNNTGKIATDSMGCIAISLHMGIFDDDLKSIVAEKLNDKVINNNYHLTTGNITTKYVLEQLSENGYIDTAYKVISNNEYPSIGYMLKRGSTTLWERFEDKKNSRMNSHNHAMYAAVGSWFYEYICGIKPAECGYSKVDIKPYYPKNLEFASAKLNTVKGDISVIWKREQDKINLTVGIPFGVVATIYADEKRVLTNGTYNFII